jgi:hypothetical protein
MEASMTDRERQKLVDEIAMDLKYAPRVQADPDRRVSKVGLEVEETLSKMTAIFLRQLRE